MIAKSFRPYEGEFLTAKKYFRVDGLNMVIGGYGQ
jgi:hypothetical protein